MSNPKPTLTPEPGETLHRVVTGGDYPFAEANKEEWARDEELLIELLRARIQNPEGHQPSKSDQIFAVVRVEKVRRTLQTAVSDLYWISDKLPAHKQAILRLIDDLEDISSHRVVALNNNIKIASAE